jgi:hypothetical protein
MSASLSVSLPAFGTPRGREAVHESQLVARTLGRNDAEISQNDRCPNTFSSIYNGILEIFHYPWQVHP